MNNTVRIILIVVLIIVFVSSSVLLGFVIYDAQRSQKQFDYLSGLIELPPADSTDSTQSTPTTNQPGAITNPNNPNTSNTPAITRNIKKLKEMNSDCIGWIYIEDTSVNYPVMYTPKEAEKYLRKNFYGKYSTGGVPFIDIRCPLNSKNLIIYGHNMKNGTMFGGLKNYINEDYRKAHKYLEFETADGCWYYEVVDVKVTNVKDAWYDYNILNTTEGDTYLTLSTCHGSDKSGRLLVIFKKIIF